MTRRSGLPSVELWLDPGSVTPNPGGNPLQANWFFAHLSPVDGAAAGQGTGGGEMVMAMPDNELQYSHGTETGLNAVRGWRRLRRGPAAVACGACTIPT